MYKCGLRSYEERIANKYRGKDGDDKCAHKYPHAYMPTSHLLQQNLYTYIQTYTSYNSYNLPTYNFYIPSNPYTLTPLQTYPTFPTTPTLCGAFAFAFVRILCAANGFLFFCELIFLSALLKKGRVLKFPDKQQYWEIAYPTTFMINKYIYIEDYLLQCFCVRNLDHLAETANVRSHDTFINVYMHIRSCIYIHIYICVYVYSYNI